MAKKLHQVTKQELVNELSAVAFARDRRSRKKPAVTRCAVEVAIEEWSTRYATMHPEDVKADLIERVKPIVYARVKKAPDQYGFAVLTFFLTSLASMVFQIAVATAVAAIVNWWIRRKLENTATLERLSDRK